MYPLTRLGTFPAGVAGSGNVEGNSFAIECCPMITDREKFVRKGGMGVCITADKGPIWLKCCTGELNILQCFYIENIENTPDMCCQRGNAEIEDNMLHLFSSVHPLHIYVSGNFELALEKLPDTDENSGRYAVLRCPDNKLYLTAAFAEDKELAKALAKQRAEMVIQNVKEYYDEILKEWYIETPDADIDEAFVHARLNVEYGWFSPFGWIESPHHWVSFWHQEHTYAEDWAGNANRSKEVFISLIERLQDGDKVMDLSPLGTTRREWGGENIYFFRGVDHYLRQTGDIEFAAFARPYMVKILNQTFREYDPTNSGIMAFGTQIGNQEDFEGIPGKGSSSGIEGAYMLRVMSTIESILGNKDEAEKYALESKLAIDAVYKKLFLKDVGRFAWYEDLSGQMRLDPAYHSICYPINYGMMEDEAMVSSIDHLINRLSGPDGEVFISNHFGGHAHNGVATWGMQCGANNQPVATLAYSKLGMGNQAILPLKFIADIVCHRQAGSFPETAREGFKSYFTPAACMFSLGVIEGIFGLDRNMLTNTTRIAPCFPDPWDHAKIRIKGIEISYAKRGKVHTFTGKVADGTNKIFTWRLPPYGKIKAVLNNAQAEVSTTRRCGWFEAEIKLGQGQEFLLEIEYEPLEFGINHPGSVAEGDGLYLEAKGAKIVSLKDPQGIFGEVEYAENQLRLKTKEDLLKPYMPYGWFGLMNFARRTFYLNLNVDGVEFTHPLHITVLPKYALGAKLYGQDLMVSIHPMTDTPYTGTAVLAMGRESAIAEVDLKSRVTSEVKFTLSRQMLESLLPGSNKAKVILGDYVLSVDFYAEVQNKQATAIPLQEDAIKPATYWGVIGKTATAPGSSIYCVTPDDFLQDVFEKYDNLQAMPGVTFALNKKGFLPVSYDYEKFVTIDLRGRRAKKLYVLFSPFITNQHAFTTPFCMELEAVKGEEYIKPIFRVDLRFPGDLDIGLSGRGMYGFPTFINEERNDLPPMPKAKDTDYPGAMPPDYPQHYLWNRRFAFQVCETVFTVIEIELDKERDLKELRIQTLADGAAGGIYAISAI